MHEMSPTTSMMEIEGVMVVSRMACDDGAMYRSCMKASYGQVGMQQYQCL
jgi:hypothetical protein